MDIVTTIQEPVLTFVEVMELLKMSRPTLRRRIDDGSIKATRLGRKVYFRYNDLLNMKSTEVVATAQPMEKEAA